MVSCAEVLVGRYDVVSEVGRVQHSAAPRLEHGLILLNEPSEL